MERQVSSLAPSLCKSRDIGIRVWVAVLTIVGLMTFTVAVVGQERLELQARAPSWEGLAGTDGQTYSLASFAEYEVVILCFTSNTCPYSVDYEDRLISLHSRYAAAEEKKVALIAINSNATPGDALESMQQRAKEKGFEFWYLKDEGAQVAASYKAIYTPEFFVLDRERRLRYFGAMDDATKAEAVKRSFVVEAIDALRAGQDPEVASHPARGCKIRVPRRRRDLLD